MPSCIPVSSSSDSCDLDFESFDPSLRSGFFKRLKARGIHKEPRLKEISRAALKDDPPIKPPEWQCCNSSCGIDCVVTMWWEEEKTWRDHHDDWKEIKERFEAEEEERRRAEEEERELNGPSASGVDGEDKVKGSVITLAAASGGPKVGIEVEVERVVEAMSATSL